MPATPPSGARLPRICAIALAIFVAPALFAQAPELAEVVATRSLWPREVTLRTAVTVPIQFQGREAGSVPLPAGRVLRVTKVEMTRVTMDFNGSAVVVAPSQTDLMQRVLMTFSAGRAPMPPAAPTRSLTPPPSQTAPATPPIPAAQNTAATPVPAAGEKSRAALPQTSGWHRRIRLPTLPSAPGALPGVTVGLNAEVEEFDLYLPKNFDPKRPAGLIVYVSPAPNPDIPERYTALWDEHGLIVVGAYRSSNEEKVERRAGLAIASQLALRTQYQIDPRRVFVSGMSGGGRMSTRLGLMAPQYFKGVLAHCGADFYKDYPVTRKSAQMRPGHQGHHWPAFTGNQRATPASLVQARAETRFVLLSGPEDTAKNHFDWEAAMKADGFKTLLVMEPGLGHDFCSGESYRRGLEFVLGLSK